MIFAFLASIISPIGVIGTKVIYRKEKVNWKAFLGLSAFFTFLVTLLTFPLWEKETVNLITPIIVGLFFVDIIVAVLYNSLFYYSISGEHLADIEPIAMMHPLASMAIAVLLFPSERNWPVILLGGVAVLTLVISRIEKHHLKLNKYLLAAFGFVILVGIESSIVKVITEKIDPLMLYTARIGVLSLCLLLFLKPNFNLIGKKRLKSIFFISALTAIEMLLIFYSIPKIGVVKTSVIYLLAPVLIIIGSRIYLGENIKVRSWIADTIIVICVFLSIIVTR